MHVCGNIRAGNTDAGVNYTSSPYIGIAGTGGQSPLFIAHASGYGLAYFGYDACGDRLIIATDNGAGNNKIDFSVNAGTNANANNVCGITPAMRITSCGYLYVGQVWNDSSHRITNSVTQGNTVLIVSGYNTSDNNSVDIRAASGTSANGANTVVWVSTNSSTGRSINAGGTINASGTDYAEYMTKAIEDSIAKGDIVGVDINGLLTNTFADAKSFVVKSTDPSYVGGDVWGNEEALGEKRPRKTTDQSEEEYNALLAEFEIKLEAERAKVDRIAFSGQVPCNITGANVGDYIIPIELENGKIGGQAVTNPTFEQYQISVGKVWKIMEDRRAWIAVKIG